MFRSDFLSEGLLSHQHINQAYFRCHHLATLHFNSDNSSKGLVTLLLTLTTLSLDDEQNVIIKQVTRASHKIQVIIQL